MGDMNRFGDDDYEGVVSSKERVPEGCKKCFVNVAGFNSFVAIDQDTGIKYNVRYDSSGGIVSSGDNVVVRPGYSRERGSRGESLLSAELVKKCD